MRHFFAHVAGESFRNDDGSDRQAIIPRCQVGEPLTLEHEPDNPHDINAMRVLRRTGEQIGYLERDFAGQVVSGRAKGTAYLAFVAGVGRGGGGQLKGERITRELAEKLAAEAGLGVQATVTKRLNLLVVADPATPSGKAKKARQYGVRIMAEAAFWKALGVRIE